MLLNLNSIDHQIHNYGNTSLTNANVNDDSGSTSSSSSTTSSKDDNLLTSSSSSSSPPPLSSSSSSAAAALLAQTSSLSSTLGLQTNTYCSLCHQDKSILTSKCIYHSYCSSCLNNLDDKCPLCCCFNQQQDQLQLSQQQLIDNDLNALLLNEFSSTTTQSTTLASITNDDDDDLNSLEPRCQGCKSIDSNAVAKCYNCSHYLCQNCVMAHQYMLCFDGHNVVNIKDMNSNTLLLQNNNNNNNSTIINLQSNNELTCIKHKNEPLKLYCVTCNLLICKECDHLRHEVHNIDDIGLLQLKNLKTTLDSTRLQTNDLKSTYTLLCKSMSYLSMQHDKAQKEILNTYSLYKQLLDERKCELQRELDQIFQSKQLIIKQLLNKFDDISTKIDSVISFADKLIKNSNINEILLFKKPIEQKLNVLATQVPDHLMSINRILNQDFDFEFQSNYQLIQSSIRNTYGQIRNTTSLNNNNNNSSNNNIELSLSPNSLFINAQSSPNNSNSSNSSNSNLSTTPTTHHHHNTQQQQQQIYKPKPIGPPNNNNNNNSLLFNSNNNNINHHSPTTITSISTNTNNPSSFIDTCSFNDTTFDAWTTSANVNNNNNNNNNNNSVTDQLILSELTSSSTSSDSHSHHQTLLDLTTSSIGCIRLPSLTTTTTTTNPMLPARSQIKRQKMIYSCKFGEFGINDGQFTEPSGVAINATNGIIVADTNSHRIQIFDRDGRFKFKFGECGKREGQLLYPNRVSVVKQTGDIIVTERSPTHQIQIYNQYGQFLRKFGANILQHPRGVCVDSKGRIIVVECKVMRVIIFDQFGNIIHKFNCSKYLEFPNGVCCNDKQEIFISDNRAHCIKVFNYDGEFLRQIGGEGITNYPIGVGINSEGEVLVADNHNNFNLTVFTQDGQLINALESKVKHAQCFDVGLMDDGSIVLASKDYRIYVYRYNSTSSTTTLNQI